MKISAEVETMRPTVLARYAGFCGETLARAHARSGDPVAMAAYLGKKDDFDNAMADFAQRYADQNEQDYRAFQDAIRSGRLQAIDGA
jgi:sugar/nucleoside kinase (ribokinase family)